MKMNRWYYLLTGIIIFLLAGMVYAWSVLSSPIGAYFENWTKAQLSLTFTICMMSFCAGCMVSGLVANKFKVKWSIWLSAVLFIGGFVMASKAETPIALYIGYGILCGFAAGLVYNMVLSTVSAWFPDKQGFVSGILLMGFGLSSFIVGKIYQYFTPSGSGIEIWRQSFMILGILIFIVLTVCGFFLRRPEVSEIESYLKDAKTKKGISIGLNITYKEMVRRPSFWLFFMWATCIGGIGMVLISQAGGIAGEVGKNVSAGTIATTVGLISVFNGISRVFFGNLYDRRGRKTTMVLVGVAFTLFSGILLAALVSGEFALIVIGFIGCGFSYAGNNTTIAAYVNESYGRDHYAGNLPVMNLNLLPAAMGGTIGGMLYDMSGSYISTVLFMICGALISLIFTFSIRKV